MVCIELCQTVLRDFEENNTWIRKKLALQSFGQGDFKSVN